MYNQSCISLFVVMPAKTKDISQAQSKDLMFQSDGLWCHRIESAKFVFGIQTEAEQKQVQVHLRSWCFNYTSSEIVSSTSWQKFWTRSSNYLYWHIITYQLCNGLKWCVVKYPKSDLSISVHESSSKFAYKVKSSLEWDIYNMQQENIAWLFFPGLFRGA